MSVLYAVKGIRHGTDEVVMLTFPADSPQEAKAIAAACGLTMVTVARHNATETDAIPDYGGRRSSSRSDERADPEASGADARPDSPPERSPPV